MSRSDVRSLLRLAAFIVALGGTYWVFIRVPYGRAIDGASYSAAAHFGGLVDAGNLFRLVVPVLIVLVAIAFGIVALVARRWADALRASAIVVGSFLLAEALKLTLPGPTMGAAGQAGNTFPSGHVAVAVSGVIALAVLLPWRPWRWPVVALATVATVGVAWTSTLSFAHRPSDVIGGALVAGIMASAVLWRGVAIVDRSRILAVVVSCAVMGSAALVVLGVVAAGRLNAADPDVSLWAWMLVSAVAVIAAVVVAPGSGPARGRPGGA
ncbi:hypothetical protein GCM10027568_20880 [Humibacter soli]